MIDNITEYSLDDIRTAYKEYLNTQNLSRNTVSTAVTGAFYIWRNCSSEMFWKVVLSKDFETFGKSTLFTLLKQQSSGNVEVNLSGYMSELRQFKNFIQNATEIDIPATSAIGSNPTNEKSEISNERTKKSSLVLPTPSIVEVESYLDKWNTFEDYGAQEHVLDRLFHNLCPENMNISDVLLKVSVLNDFYSTNIFKVYPVAKHILELNIDERLKQGDVMLVDEIKAVTISGKQLSFYSFATKYCSHHNPLDYPIYDSYVDRVFRYYRKADHFAMFSNEDLKEYVCFKKIMESFRSFYGLDKYNFKELDKYLWQLGKEHFNRYV